MLKELLAGFAFLTIVPVSNAHEARAVGIIATGSARAPAHAPQINNERGVKVTVTLQTIPADAKEWEFQVTLETHTQDLRDDLTRSAVLIADGTQYAPSSWEGDPPGGHHRKGTLRFKAVDPQPQSMELQIRLTGDTSPRSFKWLLVTGNYGKGAK